MSVSPPANCRSHVQHQTSGSGICQRAILDAHSLSHYQRPPFADRYLLGVCRGWFTFGLHPGGGWSKGALEEYLQIALQGRRRVKQQLKKRGSFEFYKTSFSYIDQASGAERVVGVPEQGGTGLISQDPLPPGSVYTASTDDVGKVGLFRLEVSTSAGTGKLRIPSGLEKGPKESMNRAFAYLQSVKGKLGWAQTLAGKDMFVEAVDLTGGNVECDAGVAFLVAFISAIQNRQVQGGTVILGDLSVQGNLKAMNSIQEPLQLALDNGAIRALLPIGNKSQFGGLPEDVVEKLDLAFYGDVDRAVVKALDG